jgi:hypothetical protein
MQPSLGIHYGSRAGIGPMGRGFSLTGFSRIERCGKDVARDGKAAPIVWDNTDCFCLDGQRLVPVSGTNGANGTIYHTEIESFSRVTSFSSSTDTLGPTNFSVETKDGRTLRYGYHTGRLEGQRDVSQGSETTVQVPARYAWALDQIEDRFGNYIAINYTSTTIGTATSFLPQSISYTGHTLASPDRGVVFEYGDITATDAVRATYVAGMAFDHTKYLSAVTVMVAESMVRHYSFGYWKVKPVPELRSITEDDGITSRDATTFNWDQSGSSDLQQVDIGDINDITGYPLPGSRLIRAADMDGDGLDDMGADLAYNSELRPKRIAS